MTNFELRGQLLQLQQKNAALDIKADATVKGVRHLLNTVCITTLIEDADIEGIASLVAELIELKGEKIRNLGTIKRIEKELS